MAVEHESEQVEDLAAEHGLNAEGETADAASQGGDVLASPVADLLPPLVLVAVVGVAIAGRISHSWLASAEAAVWESAAAVIALAWSARRWTLREKKAKDRSMEEIFDSAGPMVISIALDGSIKHMNPSAERLLGYFAGELVGTQRTSEVLAPGEGPRIIGDLQRFSGVEPDPDATPLEQLAALMETVQRMPPSQVPSLEAQFRRKDGTMFPVTLHVSALR